MNNTIDPTVYVVHCVDTEGPLFVELPAMLSNLEDILRITLPDYSQDTFDKVRAGSLDLGGKESVARELLRDHRNTYMCDWDALCTMLDNATSVEFRNKEKDSYGGGYVYNWFCCDFIGFETNPRRRATGFHVIHDYYCDRVARQSGDGVRDGIHWHFHYMSTYREAHRCATSLLNSPHVFETLARRVVEREWFPSCARCGFQTERPDSHWFLEQYVPFDFTNTAIEDWQSFQDQPDLANGKFGDWRLAPGDWSVYQPSHDNYQLPGDCRRWIARCLNVLNRFANLDEAETDKAFRRAAEGKPTLLGVASHDFRDLAPEADEVRRLLRVTSAKYPGVKYRFCEAREAIRSIVYGDELGEPVDLELRMTRDSHGMPKSVDISTVKGKVFGPVPFLAIKMKNGRCLHDNLDFALDLKSWRYSFDLETVRPEDVAVVGVGAADRYGNTAVKTLSVDA